MGDCVVTVMISTRQYVKRWETGCADREASKRVGIRRVKRAQLVEHEGVLAQTSRESLRNVSQNIMKAAGENPSLLRYNKLK